MLVVLAVVLSVQWTSPLVEQPDAALFCNQHQKEKGEVGGGGDTGLNFTMAIDACVCISAAGINFIKPASKILTY